MTVKGPNDSATRTLSRLPPLILLRAFEAVGRTGSMRKAADDIGVSHTVVSRHVRNLEAWMGCKLVAAGPRGVALTDAGEILLASVSRAFQAIATTASELRPRPRGGSIRIWSMPGLASRWLTPRISEIEKQLAGADIVLRSTSVLPDFARSEADLVIGFGPFDGLPDGAIRLVQPRMFPVASVRWLTENGMPESLARLPMLPLIHEESHRQWHDWFEAAQVQVRGPLSGPRLGDANLGFDAALAGQGIALVSRVLAQRELETAALHELFDTDIRLGGYYLLASPERRADPAIGHFTRWIADELAKSEQT
ncbi:LysR substrate-binding domain-containing protein [Polymorphum gilvum]|uniref:Putative transcriptional regulator protein, LysR family n=1 Tax=Polymorphum gilvum (strain LMG 25793 / CGMCC 1.9160 / SL003B-26A1) TaxID=991905 RepID=F2IVP0_POLGS|nr:LysR substrate-binding domain-containing protein [Polymorphum gilvum]ADZ69147.1 Putative transcriptional regulator protein, LysR family [Polymorphum gilvum SL003B-26A1]